MESDRLSITAGAKQGNDRATSWSITINNPAEAEYQMVLPPGWKLTGQLERGQGGTLHYQGMLKTPQVRFSAVKKYFKRAHIEVARNATALAAYVKKEETRVASVHDIPTLFEYQTIVARLWDEREFNKRFQDAVKKAKPLDMDELAMCYIDTLVARDIEGGRRGAEFIAINPMWRSSWKKFWRSIITRDGSSKGEGTQNAEGDAAAPCSTPAGEVGVRECETDD